MRIEAPKKIQQPQDVLFLARGFRARTSLMIDLRPVEWVSPLGVAAVLAASLWAQREGLAVAVSVPDSPDVVNYLSHIGFFAELQRQGWGAEELIVDPDYQSGANLPVMPLDTERLVEKAAETLWGVFSAARIPAPVFEQVMDVAVELTQNAREHGSPCYVVAQHYTGRLSATPGIYVAVADFGEGFAATLRDRCGRLGHCEAIERGFEDRVSRTGLPTRGFGLGYVCAAVDSHDGATLSIISRKGHLERSGRRFTSAHVPDFRGTLAAAYFPYLPPSL